MVLKREIALGAVPKAGEELRLHLDGSCVVSVHLPADPLAMSAALVALGQAGFEIVANAEDHEGWTRYALRLKR